MLEHINLDHAYSNLAYIRRLKFSINYGNYLFRNYNWLSLCSVNYVLANNNLDRVYSNLLSVYGLSFE